MSVAARGSVALGARVVLLALLGIAFPVLFALAVVAAGVAVAFAVGHFAGFLLKLLWLLVFPLFAALRALWITPPHGEGEPLIPAHAPELFMTIERLRAAARAAPVHGVYLTGDFNASMSQVPRFGIFGGTRNELRLGIPLMTAMDEAHFTAVLAHEIGHLARRHGSFHARIYAMRTTLELMVAELEHRRSPLVYPVAAFYRAFVPRFELASLALSRAVELEADAASAAAAGTRIAAEALIMTHAVDAYTDADVWPAVYRRVADEPEPPEDVYAALAERFRVPLADGRRFVAAVLAEPTMPFNSHPSVADRLRALGLDPAAMEDALDGYAVRERSAADTFLQAAGAQRRALAQEWRLAVRARWHQEHAEAVKARAQLATLDALGETADPAQRRERALLAARTGRTDACDLLIASSDAEPHEADVALRAGALLAENEDERCVRYFARAIAADPRTTPVAAALSRAFFTRRNDAAGVAEWDARIARWRTGVAAAEEERSRFTGHEPIETHGLSDEELAPFRHALDLPDLVAAYLARRRLSHLPEIPHFVLAVVRDKGKYGTSDENLATIVRDDLSSFAYGVTVVVSSKRRNAVVEALRAVPGTELVL